MAIVRLFLTKLQKSRDFLVTDSKKVIFYAIMGYDTTFTTDHPEKVFTQKDFVNKRPQAMWKNHPGKNDFRWP